MDFLFGHPDTLSCTSLGLSLQKNHVQLLFINFLSLEHGRLFYFLFPCVALFPNCWRAQTTAHNLMTNVEVASN